MFSRISWGKIQDGKWDEFEAAFKEVVAKAGAQPGLKGRMLLRDKVDPNAGFTISVWETEQDMKNYENSATMKELVLPAVEPFFTGEYKTTFVEVRYSEVNL